MTHTVTFTYRGFTASDGHVFDDGSAEPMTIEFGRGKVMPVLEEALEEMEPGEERDISIAAEDAYGSYDECKVEKVLLQDIPNGVDLPVGEYILWRNPNSPKPIPVKILSKHNGIAEFDFNHPLAGQALVYEVKVLARS